ncbi:conserved hypothetical protein [Ricinus communis]|uniref:Uncharacterized protein n=1 Tax=Ricinus communis TaxID=3988 RepID=B9TKG3_RICCO|nr:conserved hypothetical protein [Ricinus communis]
MDWCRARSEGCAGVPWRARYAGVASTARGLRPMRRAVIAESLKAPSRNATSTPLSSRSMLRSSSTTSTVSCGCWSRKRCSCGITCSRANVTGADTTSLPPMPALAPRALLSASAAASSARRAPR